MGLITIEFSENINFNRSLQYMNTSYINITLVVSDLQTFNEPLF